MSAAEVARPRRLAAFLASRHYSHGPASPSRPAAARHGEGAVPGPRLHPRSDGGGSGSASRWTPAAWPGRRPWRCPFRKREETNAARCFAKQAGRASRQRCRRIAATSVTPADAGYSCRRGHLRRQGLVSPRPSKLRRRCILTGTDRRAVHRIGRATLARRRPPPGRRRAAGCRPDGGASANGARPVRRATTARPAGWRLIGPPRPPSTAKSGRFARHTWRSRACPQGLHAG
jgi:hypothetical protein